MSCNSFSHVLEIKCKKYLRYMDLAKSYLTGYCLSRTTRILKIVDIWGANVFEPTCISKPIVNFWKTEMRDKQVYRMVRSFKGFVPNVNCRDQSLLRRQMNSFFSGSHCKTFNRSARTFISLRNFLYCVTQKFHFILVARLVLRLSMILCSQSLLLAIPI